MRYQKLKDDLETIEDQSEPYSALRTVAAAFNILGWLVIVLHFGLTIAVAFPFLESKFNELLPAILLAFLFFLFGLLFGIGIIASGQIIELALDVRNDMRVTRRYIRRLGLFFARGVETEKQE